MFTYVRVQLPASATIEVVYVIFILNTRAGRERHRDMDDIYAVGPREIVFAAVQRFALVVSAALDMVMQPGKMSCYSAGGGLESCPYRLARGWRAR